MYKIITPAEYKKCPWKNGKGLTIELAINTGGSLADFDWRLSIATVSEDGEFSNFQGYMRNLVLIEGNGIELHHNNDKVDKLTKLLSVATFDGGYKTYGKLDSGPIKDFNLMTKSDSFSGSLETYTAQQTVKLKPNQICFIYPLTKELDITSNNYPDIKTLAKEHLLHITDINSSEMTVSGENFIVIYINER